MFNVRFAFLKILINYKYNITPYVFYFYFNCSFILTFSDDVYPGTSDYFINESL